MEKSKAWVMIAKQLASSGAMADWGYATDMADRLLAYDPAANHVYDIRFEPDDRIVVTYRANPRGRLLTFVVPKWTPPEGGAA